MSKTLLLIGRSPILDSTSEHVNYLVDLYPSIGINSISTVVNTKYCAFLDDSFKSYINKVPKDTELITLEKNIVLSERWVGHFYETFRPSIRDYTKDLVVSEGKLAYFGFTHDMCISWAVLNGYKNIVLIGAADFDSEVYADLDANVHTPVFIRNDGVRDSSIDAIENFYSKHINIFTVNENSMLKVPRITIDELYKKVLDK